MSWNNGYERKKYEKKLKKQREKYKRQGMTDEQIKEIEQFDWDTFKSNRRFYSHTQPLEYDEDDSDGEEWSPLHEHFLERLSEEIHPNYENSYWWIDEIDNPALHKCVTKLSKCEKDIITLLVFDGLPQTQIAHAFFHVSDKTISIKLGQIKDKIFRCAEDERGVQQ